MMALVADSKLMPTSAPSQHHDRLDALALPPLFASGSFTSPPSSSSSSSSSSLSSSSSSSASTSTSTSSELSAAPYPPASATVLDPTPLSHPRPPHSHDSNPHRSLPSVRSAFGGGAGESRSSSLGGGGGGGAIANTVASSGSTITTASAPRLPILSSCPPPPPPSTAFPAPDSSGYPSARSDDPLRRTSSGIRKKSAISSPNSSLLLSSGLYGSGANRPGDMSSESAAVPPPGAEKRRNKLGYHRTSVACGHCRRRKIRCVVAPNEVTGRCTNCIKLRKECIFHPVDQSPADARNRHHPVTLVDRMNLCSLTPLAMSSATVPSQPYVPSSSDSTGQWRYIPGMDQNTPMSAYSFSLGNNYGVLGSTISSQYSSQPDPTSWNSSLLSTPSLDASSTASSWSQSKSVSPQFNSSSPVSSSQYPPHTGYGPSSSARAYPLASPVPSSNQYVSYPYDSSYPSQCRINGSRPVSSSSSLLPPPQDQSATHRGQIPSDMNSSSNSPSIPLNFSSTGMLTGLGVQSEGAASSHVGPFWDPLGNEVSEQPHTPVVPSQWYRSDVSSSEKATSS